MNRPKGSVRVSPVGGTIKAPEMFGGLIFMFAIIVKTKTAIKRDSFPLRFNMKDIDW